MASWELLFCATIAPSRTESTSVQGQSATFTDEENLCGARIDAGRKDISFVLMVLLFKGLGWFSSGCVWKRLKHLQDISGPLQKGVELCGPLKSYFLKLYWYTLFLDGQINDFKEIGTKKIELTQ